MGKNKRRARIVEWVLEGVFLVILFFMAINIVYSIEIIQGNSRVVYYAGVVRGASQRLVKQEMLNQPEDELIEEIDVMLYELKNGGDTYHLSPLDDSEYMAALSRVTETWGQLKDEIHKSRELGEISANLISLSEKCFYEADDMVSLAVIYSDGEAGILWYMEKIMSALIGILLLITIIKSVSAIRLSKKNRELEKISRMDANTGLPNKGYCEEILSKYEKLDAREVFGCVMFDLNNLKKINDKWGHWAGDELIKSFADILAVCAGTRIFVGRYGGDEFLAIMKDTCEEAVERFVEDVERVVKEQDKTRRYISIEYACGYAVSDIENVSSLRELLKQADKKMYQDKAQKKGLQ